MENALFYTFSTIAQTLAAAIALLGAFVLYRLQTLNAELEDAGLSVIQPYLPNQEARRLVAQRDYAGLIKFLTETPPRDAGEANNPFISSKRNRLPFLVALKGQLHCLLKFALAFTVVLIAAAVVVLASTPAIAASPGVVWGVFAVGIAAFLACLSVYAVLILKAVHEG